MTNYAHIVDGAVVSTSTRQSAECSEPCAYEVVAGWTHDGTTFHPPAPPAPRWSAEDFIERLTMEEQLAILGSDDPMVRLFTAKLYAAGVVVADDQRTQQGMAYLVSKGLLTEERRQAILSRDA
jgi:hypothetical protein